MKYIIHLEYHDSHHGIKLIHYYTYMIESKFDLWNGNFLS